MKVKFEGHSDDIVYWEAVGSKPLQRDEIGCYQSGNDLHHCTILVSSIGGREAVRVHAIYDGCWSFAVGMVEEDTLPPWTFTTCDGHAYSTRLILDTGDELVTVCKVTP